MYIWLISSKNLLMCYVKDISGKSCDIGLNLQYVIKNLLCSIGWVFIWLLRVTLVLHKTAICDIYVIVSWNVMHRSLDYTNIWYTSLWKDPIVIPMRAYHTMDYDIHFLKIYISVWFSNIFLTCIYKRHMEAFCDYSYNWVTYKGRTSPRQIARYHWSKMDNL